MGSMSSSSNSTRNAAPGAISAASATLTHCSTAIRSGARIDLAIDQIGQIIANGIDRFPRQNVGEEAFHDHARSYFFPNAARHEIEELILIHTPDRGAM